jgi:hypothetical protein
MTTSISDRARCEGSGPTCTALLEDPEGVLSDRLRWPDHVCDRGFLLESVWRWTAGVVEDTPDNMDAEKHIIIAHVSIDNAALRWGAEWPLPMGKQAVLLNHEDLGYNYYGSGYASLLNWVPFDGEEEALWALRVVRGSTSLDLFGLVRRTGEGVHRRNAPRVGAYG